MFLFFFVSASQCTSSILKKRCFLRIPIPTLSLSILESGSLRPPPPPSKTRFASRTFPADQAAMASEALPVPVEDTDSDSERKQTMP